MRETRQSGFDEREQETGPGQTGLRWRGESQSHIHREATVTAPVLDSTPVGAAIYGAVSWTSTQNAVNRTRRWMSCLSNLWGKALDPGAINSCLL